VANSRLVPIIKHKPENHLEVMHASVISKNLGKQLVIAVL
jgi:hypothetical protein